MYVFTDNPIMAQIKLGEVTVNTEKPNSVSNIFLKMDVGKIRPYINYERLNQNAVRTIGSTRNRKQFVLL